MGKSISSPKFASKGKICYQLLSHISWFEASFLLYDLQTIEDEAIYVPQYFRNQQLTTTQPQESKNAKWRTPFLFGTCNDKEIDDARLKFM
jgi:hypothetical protein